MPQEPEAAERCQDQAEGEVAAAVREGPGSARTGAILSAGHADAILGSSGGAWRSEIGRWIAAANSPSATLSHHIAS